MAIERNIWNVEMKYATLEQMQDMEFGCTGRYATVDGYEYEMLVDRDGEFYGWANKHIDVNGEWTGDWDRVPEEDLNMIGQ